MICSMYTSSIQGSSSSRRRIGKYDVFLSCGEDTRNTFTDYLLGHLNFKCIFAIKDAGNQQGEQIVPQLLRAIKDSRVYIIVFSKDYAKSTRSLEVMAAIAECIKAKGQTVLPVFYDVDPSDVHCQKGIYKDAFDLHTKKFKESPDKVDGWRRAMKDLTNLDGCDVREKPWVEEIKKIAEEIIIKLDHKASKLVHKVSGLADDLVGIKSHVKELEKLLKLSSKDNDSRVLGIWGMDGIGKTTIAKVLYDKILDKFDAYCFIKDISKTYADGGPIAVQKQILDQTLDTKDLGTYSALEIDWRVRTSLSNKRVLLVLDDVDESKQLEDVGINSELLGAGSRIIITTRDEHILKVCEADEVYKVPLLNDDDAYELLRREAFTWDDKSNDFKELTPKVLKYAQGLPLAIQVLGSFLNINDATQWPDAFDRLRNNPPDRILNVLQISFEKLKPTEKEIFLDIACFFNGEREDYVKQILDCRGLYPAIGISVLIEKSLITVKDQRIQMHEMLQELGKKIVREKFRSNPELWSRLWLYEDFHHVMTGKKEEIDAKALVLDPRDDVSGLCPLSAEKFSKMKDLRLLILYHQNFSENLNYMSNKLRYISWHGYPFPSLPSSFEPDKLVELHMPGSSIKQLWEGTKRLPKLRRMDLSDSKYLEMTPDFTRIPNLEWVDFAGCTNLVQVDQSIRHLKKLVFLSLRNCSNLVSGDSISGLSSLKVLDLAGCTKLAIMSDFRRLSNLEFLDLEQCTSLTKVDESIGDLTKLKSLKLRYCTNLKSIPRSINNIINSLKILDFYGCSKLESLPLTQRTTGAIDSLESQNLIYLNLGFCNLSEVPAGIGQLSCLERLNLEGNNFVTLPSTIKELSSLTCLNLSHCKKLQTLPELPSTSASSVGRYFSTVEGAHRHRSGLYIFNCPKLGSGDNQDNSSSQSKEEIERHSNKLAHLWLERLLQEPRHFRSGFDIVIPGSEIPEWFDAQFIGGSIRIQQCSDVDDDNNWIGIAFCVAFVVNRDPETSYDPFYLAFESGQAEWSFDMPLHLDLVDVDGSQHLWLIYISREHCPFVKTGTRVTFIARRPRVELKNWGFRWVVKEDMEPQYGPLQSLNTSQRNKVHHLPFSYVHESSSYSEPTTSSKTPLDMSKNVKFQLPYNSVMTEEEKQEQEEARQNSLNWWRNRSKREIAGDEEEIEGAGQVKKQRV